MLVIVLHLMSTGSNLYSWEVHCFYLKVINKALYEPGLTQLAQGEEDFFHHLALDK
jgi:hypothetical protein